MPKSISSIVVLLLTATCCNTAVITEKDLDIGTSLIPHAGNGVFTRVFIPANTYLGSYAGKFITRQEHMKLFREDKWHYVMGLLECAETNTGGFTNIDGVNGNVFTRMNYAPKEFQNVRFVKTCDPPFVKILSTKDVKPGEELYVDYGEHYIYDFMLDPEVIRFFREKGQQR